VTTLNAHESARNIYNDFDDPLEIYNNQEVTRIEPVGEMKDDQELDGWG
jgi:hypothetical protein